jgi:hypothetical protein
MFLSRSLLRNQEACREIGVPDHMTLTHSEYNRLAPILAHYHHSAFATSLSIPGIVSNQVPILEASARQVLHDQIVAAGSSIPTPWPLSKISFKDIWKLRMKRNDFAEYLNEMHDATRRGSQEQYSEAMRRFGRHIASVLSLDFSTIKPEELASALDGRVFAGAAGPEETTRVVRFAISFCRDFSSSIGKKTQVRWLFRKLKDVRADIR